jgi:hypothetical protein
MFTLDSHLNLLKSLGVRRYMQQIIYFNLWLIDLNNTQLKKNL